MPTTEQWTEARQMTRVTEKPGDAEKWEAYTKLSTYDERIAWRVREGHAEFCRLQRLNFHGFI